MGQQSKYLITTADEKSWRADLPVLCLGAWCCCYDRKEQWESLRAEIVPYHWDDRVKMYSDYLYLRDLHETLLSELSEALNAFHGRQYSLRYWRILIGPWLLYFTQMLFDRWEMIQVAINNYKIEKTSIVVYSQKCLIPRDMSGFRGLYSNDAWNHFIYGRILSRWTSIECEYIPLEGCKENKSFNFEVKKKYQHSVKQLLFKGVSRCSQLFSSSRSPFFMETYLPLQQEMLLQLALGQVPVIYQKKTVGYVEPDLDIRRKFRLNPELYMNFENCIRALIPEQIPTIYLEGYEQLEKTVSDLSWPDNSKIIFTSASYNADDIFKAWAGRMVEKGTPLVIGQHGGNLGSALWSSSEDHENSIADMYLTWGWRDENPKQYPIGVLKRLGRNNGVWNPKGNLLLVTSVMPRFSYVMGSYAVATTQVESDLENQYKFVRHLRCDVREKIMIRLFQPDWGWAQEKRWRDKFQNISIDSSGQPIKKLIKSSRLCIVTYNATTILETLSQNVPTIVFWNPVYWELRPSAKPYFNKLREAGILFDNPKDAAEKVGKVWSDVDSWWGSAEIQDAREYFCDRYARTQDKPIRKLYEALTTVIKK